MDVADKQPVSHDAVSGSDRLPTVSYGPFRLLEALPWLMLAAAMRLVAHRNGLVLLPGMAIASASLFIAFLLAARRMIEMSDGMTRLGELDFAAQRRLTGWVLGRVLLLLLALSSIVAMLGGTKFAPHFMFGFDGIAFDQATWIGMVWSGWLAALVLLIVIQAGESRALSLREALREMAARWAYLLPAILAIALFQIVVSTIQGGVRHLVWVYWQTSPSPINIKSLVYFAFIVGFATLRLWGVLWILTVALRWSYRHRAD